MEKNLNVEELMGLGNEARLKKDYELSVKYYQQAADAGETDAMAQMGFFYQRGQGVEQSFDKAIEWYQKILDAGDVDGWYLLGTVYEDMEEYAKAVECYEKQVDEGGTCKYNAYYGLGKAYRFGWGKEKNFPLALDLYQRAAGNGEIEAMVDLGEMYFQGDGVKEDNEIANYWFEKAATSYNGNWCAFAHLGMAYHRGWGKEIDYDKAKDYYEKALEAGEDDVLCLLGQIYYDDEQYEKAMEYFMRAAVDGNEFQANAEDYIADMYRLSQGVEQDFAEAFSWYEKGAEHGNQDSMCSLAVRYMNGEGVEIDKEKAAYWMIEAAKNGSVKAMCNLGNMYYNGECVPQDDVASMAWDERAAENGDTEAMFDMGMRYYKGDVVEENWDQAKVWFEKAFEAGNDDALYYLAKIYDCFGNHDRAMEIFLKMAGDDTNDDQSVAEGMLGYKYQNGYGVDKDIAKAIEWYNKSIKHGNKFSMLDLGDIYRDGDGVEKNLDKAKELYEKAKDAGNEEAEQRLADLS